MEYEKMLKRAIEKIPKKVESKSRFEIPQVVRAVSGARTVIKNFGQILSALRREPHHLSKYLFKQLATAGSIQNQELVLQGNIQQEKLQKKLEDYVKAFVYCKVCGEPDTKLIKEGRIVFLKCDACGAKHPVGST